MDAALHSRRIFLTGGRGSLAGVLAADLRAAGAQVTSFSRTAGGGHRALDELADPAVLGDADALLHLAWSTVPLTAEQNPGEEERHDLPLLRRLLAGMGRLPAGLRPHLIFFSSGGTVYGNALGGRPHREDDPCAPIGRHGRGKLAGERALVEAAGAAELPWTILRVSNPYGFPVPPERRQGIIPVAIRAAREGQPLPLWGDGTARKDFLHHSDFAAAVRGVVARRLTGTFNVCSGESHTVREILGLVEAATGRTITITPGPAHFPWDVHDSLLDNQRLSAALGWRPAVPLAEGIRRAAQEAGWR